MITLLQISILFGKLTLKLSHLFLHGVTITFPILEIYVQIGNQCLPLNAAQQFNFVLLLSVGNIRFFL